MAKENLDIIIRAKDYASSTLKNVAGGLSAMVLFKKSYDILSAGVSAYNESEQATNRLNAALALLGKQAETKSFENLAAQIQGITTIEDDALKGTIALGASMGKMSGDTLTKATYAAIGLSKALNMDVNTAMTLVSKAANGNITAFSKYGIVIDETKTKEEQFNEILNRGVGAFSMATAEVNTTAGAYQQAKNYLGDYMESIGEAIVTSDDFQWALQKVGFIVKNWKLYFDIGVNAIALAFEQAGSYINSWADTSFKYVEWFIDNWTKLIWDGVRYVGTIFSNLGENIKNLWVQMIRFMTGRGFDFEWTSLTEGFKKTISDLPQAASREISDTEKYLSGMLDGSLEALERAKQEARKPIDLTKLGKAKLSVNPASAAAEEAKKASVKEVTQTNNAAMESRFMRFRQGGTPDQAQQETASNTKTTARYTKEMAKLIATLISKEDKPLLANSGGTKISKVSLA